MLRGIGIAAVVAGHAWSGTGVPPFSPYSFHMPLFFFLSGLFFDETRFEEPVQMVLKTARTFLVPTTVFFLVYAVLTQVIAWGGFTKLAHPLSMRDVFLNQFAGSEAYGFTSPYWFIPCLFFVRIYFSLIHSKLAHTARVVLGNRSAVVHAAFGLLYLVIALAAVHAARKMYLGGYVQWDWIIPLRVAFAAFFYYLGYLASFYRIERLVGSAVVLMLLYVVQQQTWATGRVLDFWMQIMKFENTILPFVTSILGIAFFYGISVLASGKHGTRILEVLGKNGMPIVLHHLFSFFLVNLALCAAGVIKPADVTGPYYQFHTERLWYVYVFAGLVLPLAIDRYLVDPIRKIGSRYSARLATDKPRREHGVQRVQPRADRHD